MIAQRIVEVDAVVMSVPSPPRIIAAVRLIWQAIAILCRRLVH
jgi:hypothetical protein